MKINYSTILLILYLLPLGWLLFFYADANYSRMESSQLAEPNFVPFKNIIHFIEYYLNGNHGWEVRWTFIKNLVGNIVLFIPLGALLLINFPSLHRSKLVAACLFLIVIISVELIQWISGVGVFDVDDIILNISGAMLGYFIGRSWMLSV